MNPTAIFMLLIGSYMAFGIPVQLWFEWKRFKARSARTTGVVIGHEKRSMRQSAREAPMFTYHPRVQYTVDDCTYECVSSSGNSWSKKQVNQRIDVLYNPDDPADGDTPSLMAHPAFMYSAAIACFISGLVLLYFVPSVWADTGS